jgi:hydroxymethylbilane synthase
MTPADGLNPRPLVFATRPSALARWQTQSIVDALQVAWPGLQCEQQVIATRGDAILDRPLPSIGGKGLFTRELEAELLSGRVHAAVHSLKDLPVEPVEGLAIVALPARGEPRDVLVSARGYRLDELPEGARVGTSSLRRRAQLLACRPDLRVESLRGNVDTRLKKALDGSYDGILLAGAGLVRLGLAQYITQWLPLDQFTPAPGQGALAVQCCSADREARACLEVLDDRATRLAVTAERAFLSGLGGGCSLPIGAYACLSEDQIELLGVVADPRGGSLIRLAGQGPEPNALGLALARQALEQGAGQILALE